MPHPERTLKATAAKSPPRNHSVAVLLSLFGGPDKVTVLTGAGCSTASGIPDYRDDSGNWKHPQPVQLEAFLSDAPTRQRYWARSFAGFGRIANAKPNAAHLALAALERLCKIE